MNHKKDDKKKAMLEERCQTILLGLLRDVDNRYCVDCDAKGPRWASWSIGIFLCIRCAGIHRNLGVHISRVKSVNLDTWTPEQVVSLQQMGNSRARAVYEALLSDGFRRPQTDSGLESFIRAKYEQKKYIAREWVAQPLPVVNWEQEIEEELENLKRKKKPNQASPMIEPTSSSTVSPRVSTPVAIPAPLPKAKGTSNSPKLRSEVKRTPSAASSLTNSDLLGLNTSNTSSSPVNKSNFDSNSGANDSFNNFFSEISSPALQAKDSIISTVPATTPSFGMSGNTGVNNLQKEEEDFFNQKALSGQDKNKMTKDSIMALYGMNNTFAAPNAFMPPNANNFNMGQPPQQFANPGQFYQPPAQQAQQDQFFAQFNSFQQPQQQNGNGNFGNFVQTPFQANFAAPVANSYQMNTQKLNEDNIKKIESLNFNNFK